MALRVSTVSADVFLQDLGTTVVHPTSYRDLSLEFTAVELRDSVTLTTAIQNGTLIVDDGTFSIAATDYDSDEVLLQQLNIRGDTKYISNDELRSIGDIAIQPGVFPLPINSTAQSTRNVYCVGGKWITWNLEVEDIIVITGNAAAGTYTVESVTDQQNFIVKESILNSTGGSLTVYNQKATTRIGVDDTPYSHVTGTNLDEILISIDDLIGTTASGINSIEHRSLDQLVHLIAETSYEEVTYSGIHPISDIIWTDVGKTVKIREEQYIWSGNHINTLTAIQYNVSGVEVERIVETYTYAGSKVTSIARSLT